MKISSIYLENFRNYTKQNIEFCGDLNVFIGANASGKTNLLESVYVMGVGKSFKTLKDKEMVKWNEKNAYLKLVLEKKYRNHTIEMQIDEKGHKKILINKIPVAKIGEIIGLLGVVLFSPEELKFIKDGPSERRRFIDISLSQQQKPYYYNLVQYNKILSQRNKLLKEHYNPKSIEDMLCIWDNELAKKNAIIVEKRQEYLEKLSKIANEKMQILTSGKEELKLSYETKIEGENHQKLIDNFTEILKNNREKDIKMQYTTEGIHRDDMKILVNDIDIRKFGSQGQQRSTALAIKLAEIEMFTLKTGETPILLLDDVLSELDKQRQIQLIKATENIQTIITSTDYELDDNIKKRIFNVKNGNINI